MNQELLKKLERANKTLERIKSDHDDIVAEIEETQERKMALFLIAIEKTQIVVKDDNRFQ